MTRDIESAHRRRRHATPTFFVNGRRVMDRSLGGLEVAIRAAIADR